MFIISQNRVKSMFLEEVSNYFTKNKIAFNPEVYIDGIGLKHRISLLVARAGKKSHLVETINKPNKKDIFLSQIMKFIDIEKGISPYSKSKKFLVINDTEQKPKNSLLELTKSHNVIPCSWSEKEKIIEIIQSDTQ